VLRSPAFLAGETDTAFLDRHPPAALAASAAADAEAVRLHAAVAALAAQAARRAAAPVQRTIPSGWRNNPSQLQRTELHGPTGRLAVGYRLDRTGALETLEVDGDPLPEPRLWSCTSDLVDLQVAGVRRRYEVHRVEHTSFVDSALGHTTLEERDPGWGSSSAAADPAARAGSGERVGSGERAGSAGRAGSGEQAGSELWTAGGSPVRAGLRSPTGGPGAEAGGSGVGAAGSGERAGASGVGAVGSGGGGAGGVGAADGLAAPLPGVVRRVAVEVGDRVEAGTVVVVIEAMKTEHRIAAPRPGRVRRVLVAEGQEVPAGAPVALLDDPGDDAPATGNAAGTTGGAASIAHGEPASGEPASGEPEAGDG
jgi:biotin carboxyl carrier protein